MKVNKYLLLIAVLLPVLCGTVFARVSGWDLFIPLGIGSTIFLMASGYFIEYVTNDSE